MFICAVLGKCKHEELHIASLLCDTQPLI